MKWITSASASASVPARCSNLLAVIWLCYADLCTEKQCNRKLLPNNINLIGFLLAPAKAKFVRNGDKIQTPQSIQLLSQCCVSVNQKWAGKLESKSNLSQRIKVNKNIRKSHKIMPVKHILIIHFCLFLLKTGRKRKAIDTHSAFLTLCKIKPLRNTLMNM